MGLVDPESIDSIKTYEKIPQEIRDKIRYLKLPGRIYMKNLNFIEKFIVKVFDSHQQDIDKVSFEKADKIIEWLSEDSLG